jgi:HSP20 family protein
MAFLNRWDPFTEMARLQDEVSRQFTADRRFTGSFTPAVDIFEDKDSIHVKVELPGLKAENVNVHVENQLLTISGERKLENEESGTGKANGYHRVERSYGSFTRSFSLPSNVSGDRIEADMKDGILDVKLPKKEEAQPKRIPVGTGSKPIPAAKA